MDSVTQLGTAIQNYGLTSVIIGAIIYLIIQAITMTIKFLLERKKENKTKDNSGDKDNNNKNNYIPHDIMSIKQLRNYHTILVKIDSLIKVRIPLMNLGGPVRTKIFKNMLTIYFNNCKKAIDELLEEDITLENFGYKNQTMIDRVLADSTEEWKEDGIPSIVISKFQEWNSSRIAYITLTINDISSSQVVDSAVEKQYMALNLYSGIIYLTFIDAEKTLVNLNGDLTGQYYKGEQIEKLH